MVKKTIQTGIPLMDYDSYSVDQYPVRYKHKNIFDPRPHLPSEYWEMVGEIHYMDSRLSSIILGEREYTELVNDTYSDNIHWSTRIEGNRLTKAEVSRITAEFSEHGSVEVRNGNQQEVLNHLYPFFMGHDFKLPWTVDTLCKVHSILMDGVNDDADPGKMRTDPVYITGDDDFLYYVACPPSDLRSQLDLVMDWLSESSMDRICAAIMFFYAFESIHPFKDGNGRTGRVLFQLLMQEFGLENFNLCKFENNLLRKTGTYYSLLSYTDKTNDYVPFIMYVTEAVHLSYGCALERFEEKDLIQHEDENIRTLAVNAKEFGSFYLNDAKEWIPSLSLQSLRTKLDRLVNLGIIEKVGRTRGTHYVFCDPFREAKMKVNELMTSRGLLSDRSESD